VMNYETSAVCDDRALVLQLTQGLEEIGVNIAPSGCYEMIAYLRMMLRWNACHNITAICDPHMGVTLHLLDSLAALPALQARSLRHLIDLGSGGGVPGVPLALADRATSMSLLESKGKKAFFLQHVVSALRLTHVRVLRARAESIQAAKLERTAILCRAVAPIPKLMVFARSFLQQGCELVVFCANLQQASQPAMQGYIHERVQLPFVAEGSRRYLLFVRKKGVTKKQP
jgi:16S rRNA (guanine527-N7)-methyltransferase